MIKKFIKDTLSSFFSLCMVTIVFGFCCQNVETAFWILVMAISLNALVILTGILADAQRRKVDEMLKDKLDEIKKEG